MGRKPPTPSKRSQWLRGCIQRSKHSTAPGAEDIPKTTSKLQISVPQSQPVKQYQRRLEDLEVNNASTSKPKRHLSHLFRCFAAHCGRARRPSARPTSWPHRLLQCFRPRKSLSGWGIAPWHRARARATKDLPTNLQLVRKKRPISMNVGTTRNKQAPRSRRLGKAVGKGVWHWNCGNCGNTAVPIM